MFKGLLLALAIVWPSHVGVSTGGRCSAVGTTQAQGDCVADGNSNPHVAHFYRACGYVEWAGRKIDDIQPPWKLIKHGDDTVAELDLWTGDSIDKATDQCKKFVKEHAKISKKLQLEYAKQRNAK